MVLDLCCERLKIGGRGGEPRKGVVLWSVFDRINKVSKREEAVRTSY